jgi:hypothetical protein
VLKLPEFYSIHSDLMASAAEKAYYQKSYGPGRVGMVMALSHVNVSKKISFMSGARLGNAAMNFLLHCS